MDHKFKIIDYIDSEDVMDKGISSSLSVAKDALGFLNRDYNKETQEYTDVDYTDEEITRKIKSMVEQVVSTYDGKYIIHSYQGIRCGFGWATVVGKTFHCHGGFYGPLPNGNKLYTATVKWWEAIIDRAFNDGYTTFEIELRKDQSIDTVARAVMPKTKYENYTFEDYTEHYWLLKVTA